MAIKPILFNTEMVRAIMDGRKSCTRRMVKPQPNEKHTYPLGFVTDSTEKKEVGCFGFGINEYSSSIQYTKPQYQPGDILYVRETWGHPISLNSDKQYVFRADKIAESGFKNDSHIWHPSIHMPKEAARIWLKVTDVRVERLQDVTDDDAEAEGCFDYTSTALGFPDIWDSTIKKSDLDRYGWDTNPWVWVIEFERCEKPQGV
ncbi:hypothetical protein DW272_02265 [Blautia obeum]|jgi:hypothetical protein|uniref:Morphogenetic protein n=1 Tax=Blautia obeum TaxID=40520 RepID=A0A414SKD2_9FIRM|nr:hypothetical protein [Blautia obeum]RHG20050.1 hypothetical protein DW272_02265 [Blautia obeum]